MNASSVTGGEKTIVCLHCFVLNVFMYAHLDEFPDHAGSFCWPVCDACDEDDDSIGLDWVEDKGVSTDSFTFKGAA